MKSVKLKIILATAALALISGCATVKPVHNVTDAPVAVVKQNVSLDEVSKAIIRAGAALGWQMNPVQPGLIVGTLKLRTHTAVVDVTYDTKTYSIKYKDSTNLNYDGANIHKNYNGWIENLDKGIRVQLTTL